MAALRDAARTNATDLTDILETSIPELELNAFINAASFTVDEIAEAEPDTPEARLAEIEKWLAAHLTTTRPDQPASEEQESYSVEYLRETSYGETAMSLDPSNVLSPTGRVIEFSAPDAKGTRGSD